MAVFLDIFSDIAPSAEGGIDESVVARQLDAIGDAREITVRINSRGGSAYSGLAIFNLLSQHPARKTGVVLGVAASAATLPLMSCERVHVPSNGQIMLHDPATFAFGGTREFEAAIEQLKGLKDACVAVYASRSGQSRTKVSQMMTEETWLNGEQAVAMGFADSVDTPALIPASAPKMSSGKLPFRFQHAPTDLDRRLAMTAGAYPVSATAAVPAPAAASPDVGEVITRERNRIANIVAACNLAGCPEHAEGWIARGVPLESVQRSLREILCNGRPPVGEFAGNLVSGPDMRFGREFDEQRSTFEANGVSRDAYIRGRRIDTGLETVVPAQGLTMWSDSN